MLFILYVGYSMILGILNGLFPNLANHSYSQDFIGRLITDHPFKAFVTIVIMAPLLEEMMFRTVVRPSHADIILFMSAWPVVFLVGFIPADVHWALKMIFTFIFLVTVFYILVQLIPAPSTVTTRRFLKKWKWSMALLSSLVFGFVHIANYVEGFVINIPLVLLIFPRILAGLMLGWIKIRNGSLPWPMALHAVNNGFAFMLMLIYSS